MGQRSQAARQGAIVVHTQTLCAPVDDGALLHLAALEGADALRVYQPGRSLLAARADGVICRALARHGRAQLVLLHTGGAGPNEPCAPRRATGNDEKNTRKRPGAGGRERQRGRVPALGVQSQGDGGFKSQRSRDSAHHSERTTQKNKARFTLRVNRVRCYN